MKKLVVSVLILVFAVAFALPTLAAGTNIAANATWTASSEYNDDYAASNVITDDIEWDGEEWASAGEIDPWLTAEFPEEVWINKIVLFDRPNATDWSESGVIKFSNGSTVEYSDVDNEGVPFEVIFEPKKIKSFTIEIIGSENSSNNGFAKVEVYDCDAPAIAAPVLEETAPVAEAQPETQPAQVAVSQAPQTSDSGTAIFLLLMAVSGAIIIKNRRQVKTK